ncbi:MAG: TIGR01212 family radical SAM protein [Candidatus Omnitrophota bacterium]
MREKYYSFNHYLKEKFGQRVHRISIDAGFDCPNIDGTLSKDGCSYCNNKGFSVNTGKLKSIEDQIEEAIAFYPKRFKVQKFIAYFQPNTNTYADVETLREKYDIIKKYPQIIGLFISTRPDCVDDEKIKLLSSYAKKYLVWVEYGLQTTDDRLLIEINRNHTYEDFLSALNLTRRYGINVAAHLIFGLPGQNHEKIMEDARRLSNLDIQGIKFHILHVLKKTKLEGRYNKGGFKLLSEAEYVRLICDFLERLPSDLAVLRLVSTANPDYLIAPKWINNKHAVIDAINREFIRRGTCQGFCKTREQMQNT